MTEGSPPDVSKCYQPIDLGGKSCKERVSGTSKISTKKDISEEARALRQRKVKATGALVDLGSVEEHYTFGTWQVVEPYLEDALLRRRYKIEYAAVGYDRKRVELVADVASYMGMARARSTVALLSSVRLEEFSMWEDTPVLLFLDIWPQLCLDQNRLLDTFAPLPADTFDAKGASDWQVQNDLVE